MPWGEKASRQGCSADLSKLLPSIRRHCGACPGNPSVMDLRVTLWNRRDTGPSSALYLKPTSDLLKRRLNMAELTLYHSAPSRSSVVLWMLEEIGEPYDIHLLSIKQG